MLHGPFDWEARAEAPTLLGHTRGYQRRQRLANIAFAVEARNCVEGLEYRLTDLVGNLIAHPLAELHGSHWVGHRLERFSARLMQGACMAHGQPLA